MLLSFLCVSKRKEEERDLKNCARRKIFSGRFFSTLLAKKGLTRINKLSITMATVRVDPDKYSSRASGAAGDYLKGSQAPRRSQSQAAVAAAGNYSTGVSEAISRGAFEKGLQRAGDQKWLKGIQEKGRTRYQQGVSLAADSWRSGFQPFAAALQGLELGPKGPKGTNYDRVQQVGELLRNTKLSR